MRPFRDRRDAGRRLGARLLGLRGSSPLVLAVPRGGVVVGYEVAEALGAPLDVLVARKLADPEDPELAVGAVAEGDDPAELPPEAQGADEAYLRREAARALAEVSRRARLYRAGAGLPGVSGRTVVLVDDGAATGASLSAALRALRRLGPGRVVLALPVASEAALASLSAEADEVVCLETPVPFLSVGTHYESFEQTEDAEVLSLLESARGKK